MPESHSGDVVLLVDDAPDNLAVLAEMLEVDGYTVLIANDGERAIASALRASPDLILLDAVMPGMDGFQTCRKLKSDAATRDIPVIFMTGLAETEHVLAGFESGGVDYVTKPVRPEIVLARVSAQLRSARTASRARDALEVSGVAAIVLDSKASPVWQTPCAARLLEEFFSPRESGEQLPEALRHWLAQNSFARGGEVTSDISANIGDRESLRVRWVKPHTASESLLMLDRVSASKTAVSISGKLDLTPREWEVLMWVAKGKTNRDIGEILSLSPRTVNKHLEHIYQKLGVETRTAAAAMALRFKAQS